MLYDKYDTQKDTRERNMHKLFAILNMENRRPKRAVEIEREMRLRSVKAKETIYNLLKIAQNNGSVEKILSDGKVKYVLTDEGMRKYSAMWVLMHELMELEHENAYYIHDTIGELWGVSYDIISKSSEHIIKVGKKNLNLIDIANKTQFIIGNLLYHIMKETNANTIEGKAIISFEIDFNKFTENNFGAYKVVRKVYNKSKNIKQKQLLTRLDKNGKLILP